MIAAIIVLLAASALIAAGDVFHHRIVAELRAIKSELQVERFGLDASVNQLHKRLQAIGGTIRSDFKDAEEAVAHPILSSKEA